ncbi:hypothetical protein QP166_11860 [Sphingomonas sp. LR60]
MAKDDNAVEVVVPDGKEAREALAQLRVEPFLRHGFLTNHMAGETVRGGEIKCNSGEVGEVLREMAATITAGDLTPITNALLSQSMMLDATATELMGRAWRNVGQYPDAFQRYISLALKSQAQSRATLEALAKVHQPREQVVRHVHVHEGGQAVVAEQLHMNGQGVTNAGIADQSNAQGASVASLPSPDPLGHGVPITSRAGQAEMQDARRDESRRAARKSKRA